jgi:phosphinothricin acetyltransferase
MQLVPFDIAHINEITEIYAHYVENSAVTFDLEPPNVETLTQKFSQITNEQYPIWIAKNDEAQFVGYAYASAYRPKRAYQHTAEVTIYLHPDHLGKGIGNALLERLLQSLQSSPQFHLAIAVIADDAKASIGLHKKHDFELIGYIPEVGKKFNKWHGTTLMRRSVETG